MYNRDSKRRRKRKGIKSFIEEIMTENFSNLKKEIDNL